MGLSKNQLLFLSLLTFSIGCGKGDNPLISEGTVLKEVYRNGALNASYVYNSDGLIQRNEFYKDDGTIGQVRTFQYMGDTVITHFIDNFGSSTVEINQMAYELENSDIRVDQFRSGSLSSYTLYVFDEGCIISANIYRADGDLSVEETHTIVGDHCSRETTLVFQSFNHQINYRDYRDGKQRYDMSASPLFLARINPHNTVNFEFLDDEGNIDPRLSYSSTFIYNSFNFPAIETRIEEDANRPDVIRYVYD